MPLVEVTLQRVGSEELTNAKYGEIGCTLSYILQKLGWPCQGASSQDIGTVTSRVRSQSSCGLCLQINIALVLSAGTCFNHCPYVEELL